MFVFGTNAPPEVSVRIRLEFFCAKRATEGGVGLRLELALDFIPRLWSMKERHPVLCRALRHEFGLDT
jgi:hypothetical protein